MMKSKSFLVLPFLMVAMLLSAQHARAGVVIGTVDIQKILLTVNEGKKVRKQLESFFNDKKKVLKDEESKIKKAQDDFSKKEKLLSEAAKKNKEEEIRTMIYNLQNKTAEYQNEIQNEESKLKKPILDKLKDIINDVSKKSEVAMTVEISTSPLVYAENSKDLTDDVIKAYDSKHPGK